MPSLTVTYVSRLSVTYVSGPYRSCLFGPFDECSERDIIVCRKVVAHGIIDDSEKLSLDGVALCRKSLRHGQIIHR